MHLQVGSQATQRISPMSVNDCNDLFQAKRLDEDRVGTVQVAGRHKGSRRRSVDGGTNLGVYTSTHPTLSLRKGFFCPGLG